ncbi:hypothetical protein E2C01_081037 [Portunus trituberculatus]|uniref:Uncharacterized protein n=1 Tax=Portunus trituberculatus TaxID=210409 RepID=A0A5B7J001_PORTR|nr:hypothetical protein [Portunus trituberculatus]
MFVFAGAGVARAGGARVQAEGDGGRSPRQG